MSITHISQPTPTPTRPGAVATTQQHIIRLAIEALQAAEKFNNSQLMKAAMILLDYADQLYQQKQGGQKNGDTHTQ